MIVFYSRNIDQSSGILDQDEARHCSKVLRKKEGDDILVFDGKGGRHSCVIASVTRHEVFFDVRETSLENVETCLPSIGISILKNASRMEWFFEKAVEIGVRSVYPLICDRSERGRMKMQRAEGIMISAMKQSLRTYLPKLNEPMIYSEFVESCVPDNAKFICHFDEKNQHLYDVMIEDASSYLLIGPEGDFSNTELEFAKKNEYIQVNISQTRLRAETAGIVALDIVALKNR